jgi:hypothetical protein
MTLLWFVIWIIADNWGGREPLVFDPVNFWVGALILAIAIDLSGHHAAPAVRGKKGNGGD